MKFLQELFLGILKESLGTTERNLGENPEAILDGIHPGIPGGNFSSYPCGEFLYKNFGKFVHQSF